MKNSYRRNGAKWHQTRYGKGERKTYSEWYDNGPLCKVEHYNFYGKKDGLWTWYHKNGQLQKVCKYRFGKLDSLEAGYAENGQQLYVHHFEYGVYTDSIARYFYPDGSLEKKGALDEMAGKVGAIPSGAWEFYFNTGVLKGKGSFAVGVTGYKSECGHLTCRLINFYILQRVGMRLISR